MKKTLTGLLVGLLFSGAVWADGVMKSAHNGRMVESAGFRFEMVAKDGRLEIYVTDHSDKPVGAEKLTGRVTLLAEKSKVEIPLAPAGENLLAGEGTVTGQPAAIIIVEGMTKRITARLPAGQP